jgi:hypothetical protein
MQSVPLDQGKYFVCRRNDCILQALQIGDRALSGTGGCSAGDFKHHKRMANNSSLPTTARALGR